MNKYQSFKAYLIYRKAVMVTNEAYRKKPQRYYVMPCLSDTKVLIVVDRKNFRELQRKHYIHGGFGIAELKEKCFYFTGDAKGNEPATDEQLKLRQYIYQLWYEARLSARRAERKQKRKEFFGKLFRATIGKLV